LRQRFAPRRNLIAGPFAGEFGYELMQWQGFVRARKPYYEKVHVLTYPGRDYLYEGCAVHHHEVDLKAAGYGYGLMTPGETQRRAGALAAEIGLLDYDVFEPSLLCTQYHKRLFWRQDFRVFQEPALGEIRDVAFHFRAVQKAGHDTAKNYAPQLASDLVQAFSREGLSLLCIGHPDYSLCPEGAEDRRSVDLQQTIAAINSVRLVVGENSGPMHLANLCGKATVLFAQDQWRIDYSLRWNPFRTPQYVAANDTVQPAPERLLAATKDALADLRVRTRDFKDPAYKLPAQPIAYY
jgi:hypothetical protein